MSAPRLPRRAPRGAQGCLFGGLDEPVARAAREPSEYMARAAHVVASCACAVRWRVCTRRGARVVLVTLPWPSRDAVRLLMLGAGVPVDLERDGRALVPPVEAVTLMVCGSRAARRPYQRAVACVLGAHPVAVAQGWV